MLKNLLPRKLKLILNKKTALKEIEVRFFPYSSDEVQQMRLDLKKELSEMKRAHRMNEAYRIEGKIEILESLYPDKNAEK